MLSGRLLLAFLVTLFGADAAAVSPLMLRGYTVIPYPQEVTFHGNDFEFGSEWGIQAGSGVAADALPTSMLRDEMRSRFGISLKGSAHTIELLMGEGLVTPGRAQDRNDNAIAAQAYRIQLTPSRIRVFANEDAGLLYGVETLIQLVRRQNGALWLPEAEIRDWPDLELRTIYWDDAHHLDRIETLKNAIRQAAFFKANGFAIKLEGHFQYQHAPAVVEPYALSPAELQELTDFGLRYHVQLIPYLDGPAHIAFILKHPEYAALRAFPESNYEICTTNPESYRLFEGMYGDLLAANKGVKYFILSTDEPYYVGLAENSQCSEAQRKKQSGSVGAVLSEFITKAGGYLHDHGREVIFWGEYPLKPGDISRLPGWLINGETYGPEFDPLFRQRGIRQMIYTSTEGEEKLFPNYFVLPAAQRMHEDRSVSERVIEAVRQIASSPARRTADLMGMLVAGWADMGLHPETFWLGYTTIAAAGWNARMPDPRESMSSFYRLFYGDSLVNMGRVYQLMSEQAQIWSDTWDTTDSVARKPIWGNSERIFQPKRPAHDQAIPLPGVPAALDLAYANDWQQTNAQRRREAADSLALNDELISLLQENILGAERNRYNLEVFSAIAQLFRQNLEMIGGIAEMDRSLRGAAKAARENHATEAVAGLDRALDQARVIRAERNRVLADATAVWYESWFPRVAQANGRRFLHELDDVKDHLPDRTVDMSYLVYRELLLPMDRWYEQVQRVRNEYARAHNLPEHSEALQWNALE